MNTQRRSALAALLAGPLLGTWAMAATAADWPAQKPISYVVPFTVGGSTDVVGRMLAQKLGERLHQNVIVENKPGAAGGIGATYVAKAAPDGYTLFGGTISTHAINASLYKNLKYDPVKDFEPVSLIAYLPNVLLVDPNLGVNSVADLIALLKKDPSKRTFASSGAGTSTHLAGELFSSMIGVPLTHVPYKGTPPAMVDVSSGAVTFMFDQMTAALPLLQSGKLKLLAVTEEKRSPLLPEVPTVAETLPGYELAVWYGAFGPAGMPPELTARLNQEINKILKRPEVVKKMGDMGVLLLDTTPEQFGQVLARDADKYGKLIKELGITAE